MDIVKQFLGGGYSKETIKGVSWTWALRITTRVMAFLKIVVLARLLSPAQFGVYGIAAIAMSFLDVLTETGVNVILVQEKEDIDQYISSAWIVSITRGVLMSFVLFVFSPLIAGFFKSPDSLLLLKIMSLVPLVRGFINPAVIKFQKELQFHKEFLYRSLLFIVDAITAVVLTMLTRQPSSIVLGILAGVVLEMVLSFFVVTPRPRFLFERTYIKKIIHRGKWLTMAGIFSFLFQNVDNIVVGRVLGVSPLGFYDNAYKVAMLPTTEIADVISKVTLPVFAKIQGDRSRLLKAFLKTFAIIVLLTAPIGIFFFLFPEFVIRLVLGTTWLPAAPVLKILALYGIVRVIVGIPSPLFLGMGKEKYATVISTVNFLALVILMLPFVHFFQLVGVAYAVLASCMLTLCVVIYFLFKAFR